MQSELLDITIIGCLVLLFASTYRKRATPMVRAWTFGWLLILVHFIALLFHPVSDIAQRSLIILSLASLIACGIVFLLAADNKQPQRDAHIALPLLAGLAAVGFVALDLDQVAAPLPYYLAASLVTVAWLTYSVQLKSVSTVIRTALIVSTFATTLWLFWTIAHTQQDIGISAILTQLYLVVGLLYMGTFRRISGGTLTVVFGLIAWSAVFPSATFCQHLGITSRISPEFWNVPKYFVAFGMMLILLEEEIIAANQASKHYRLLFDANPHPMWIYDPHTLAFEGVNDAAITQYGFSRDQFLGMTLTDLHPANALTHTDPTGPTLHKKSDGSLYFVDVATHHMRSNGRDLAFSLVQDVTERQELHQRLMHQANHDQLTGLPNRACLEENLRNTLTDPARHNKQSALLCIDIDRFKQINDTYGHGVGDICLQEVAARLALCVRGMDTAARVGGEEFALLLHHIYDSSDAKKVATDALLALQAPIVADRISIELTASIGIAISPADGQDATTLWRNADIAMYRAKRAGGNQYLCMSPEINSFASEANEVERCVKRALREGSFEVHYQPLYKINGELHSLEALVRLNDPELGPISPHRFVPIAEERGLIVPLGDWVMNEVCNQSALWQLAGLPPVRIALNISPLQITRPGFAAHVAEVLSAHKVDPHIIGMEITETAMMRNLGEASRQIQLLASLGICFSVDDFGTGYSSLGQLDKLRVQYLKIDRIFIDRICLSDGTCSIVDAIISMAHSLHLEVVAEGVETTEQWERLRQLNCDIVQGFLFSRPLPADQIASLLLRSAHPQPTNPNSEDHAHVA